MQRSYIILLFLILGIIFASGCIGDSEPVEYVKDEVDAETLSYEELLSKYPRNPNYPELIDYDVFLQDYKRLENTTVEEAKRRISPNPEDAELGYTLIDYGETTIEGVNVYFVEYTGFLEDSIDAEYLFEINNRWYSISWRDQLGNPNRGIIESQISRIIRDAKKVV